MEGTPSFGCGDQGSPAWGDQGPSGRFLWRGYFGQVRVSTLQDRVVIDRCAAESGVLEWRTHSGGQRNAGLRPAAIDPGILANRASFFHGLRASIAEVGIKVPVLCWGINGKIWLRYGASRVHTARNLGFTHVPAVLCLYDEKVPTGFLVQKAVQTPQAVLLAFGPLLRWATSS